MTVVEQVLRRYLGGVRSSGTNEIKALCPYHEEHNPSFYVNVHTGKYICHACGESGGDIYYLLRHLGVPPAEAKSVAEAIKEHYDPHPEVFNGPTQITLPEALLGVFQFCPNELLRQGFAKKALWEFEVGVDKKRNRITFPVRDESANLVAIVGRKLSEGGGRYQVYTEEELGTPIDFSKSDHLYNLHRIRDRRTLILVEGYKATIWLHQAGFDWTVASMGTYIGTGQAKLLRKYCETLILFHDDDDPGREFRQRAGHFLRRYLNVYTVSYPVDQVGDSPDDLEKEVIERMILSARRFSRVF